MIMMKGNNEVNNITVHFTSPNLKKSYIKNLNIINNHLFL